MNRWHFNPRERLIRVLSGESHLISWRREGKALASALIMIICTVSVVAAAGPLAHIQFSSSKNDEGGFTWHDAPSITIPRAYPAVVVLANGNILVTGGLTTGNVPTATTEIFDQKIGIWKPGPTMVTGRVGHTATLLKDGTVLVTGGQTGTGVTASAELLNTTGIASFSLMEMNFARAGHAAVLLGNGDVLVTGGSDSTGHTWKQAELYDPVGHRWLPAGNMALPRMSLSLELLSDGRALAIGGDKNGTSEMYSPSSNTWSGLTQMRSVRYDSASVTLADGRILVAGGLLNANPISSAEIFDPAASAWSDVPDMKVARASFSLALSPDGVLAAGSFSRLGTTNATELYHPGNSTWSLAKPMNKSRGAQGCAVASDGSIFEIGGWSGGAITSSVEVFGPAAPIPPPPNPPPKKPHMPIDLVPLVKECKELPGNSANGLIAKLMAAQAKYDLKEFADCIDIMNAFYHQIGAFDNSGHMTEKHVEALYSGYSSVVSYIGGNPLPPIA